MNRFAMITLGVLLWAAGAREADAQWNPATFQARRNHVYTTFGLDPALVTSVGYGRVFAVAGHDFQLATEVGVVVASLDLKDYRARMGIQTSLLHWRSLRLNGSATAIARGTENAIYRAFNWGADFTATAGVYRRHWFAAAEAGKDKAVITHITNSEWYRRYIYPDAKDGWYLDAGGTIRYGAVAGVDIGSLEISGRFGWQTTDNFESMMPPMYATIGLGIGF